MSKILVIGSANMDVTLHVKRFPHLGENVYAQDVRYSCGGKGGNAAIALSRLGVDVGFCGCIGTDQYGEQLLENLVQNGVSVQNVLHSNGDSGVAYIMVDQDGNNRIIVAPGANERMTVAELTHHVEPKIKDADMVLIQLEIAPDCIDEIIRICDRWGKRLVIDAGPVRGITIGKFANTFCVSPNKTELEALVGYELNSQHDIRKAAHVLLELNVGHVLVKLGQDGCFYSSNEEEFFYPAYPVVAVDSTAAGDSFLSGFCVSWLSDTTPRSAVDFASKCGAIAVTRYGAEQSLPYLSEINSFFECFCPNYTKKEQT